MSSTGFVNQAFCDMVNWQWYRDITVHCLFLHLLRIVNKSDKMELGISVKSGSVLISYSSLASFFKLTKKQIIYALEKLESSHDISIKNMHRQGAIITITEWNKYNGFNAINENANNAQSRDNGEKLSQKCNNQESVNKEVTTLNKNNLSQNCHINGTKQAESDEIVTKLSQNYHKQNANTEHVTNQDEKSLSQECSINSSIQSSQEPENKESSPTPLKENKEEEKECEKEKNTKKEKPTNYPFELFWDAYGKKMDRPKCERKWANLSEKDRAAIMAYLPAYIAATPDIQFRRHPSTFLNNRTWENDVIGDTAQPQLLLQFPNQQEPVPLPNTVEDVMAKLQEKHIAMPREEAEKFFNHYKALGWKKNGQPIYDWTALLPIWQSNIAQFDNHGGWQQNNQPQQNNNNEPWWKKLPTAN